MKIKLFLLAMPALIILIYSCKKDNKDSYDTPKYQILTGTASSITNTNATVKGNLQNVNGPTIITYGHVWSTTHNPTIDLKTKTAFSTIHTDISFTSHLDKLLQGKTYYVRTYATDNIGTDYGNEVTFKTEGSFFQFIVSGQYLANSHFDHYRAWVMIYNTNKELIGMTEIFNGQVYPFTEIASKKTDSYMVQIVKYRERYGIDGEGDYSLNCYLNVTPDVWYIGYDGTNYIQKGSNTLHLTDLDLNNYYHSLYYNLYNYGNYDITSKSITFPQYFDPDKIWITYNNKGEAPYYKLIENVGLNQSFNLSKSDFKIMKPINITLPQNTSSSVYSVRG